MSGCIVYLCPYSINAGSISVPIPSLQAPSLSLLHHHKPNKPQTKHITNQIQIYPFPIPAGSFFIPTPSSQASALSLPHPYRFFLCPYPIPAGSIPRTLCTAPSSDPILIPTHHLKATFLPSLYPYLIPIGPILNPTSYPQAPSSLQRPCRTHLCPHLIFTGQISISILASSLHSPS